MPTEKRGQSVPLRKMDIQSVVVGGGPVASLVVLRTHDNRDAAALQLPIRIGSVEATAISMGVTPRPGSRPRSEGPPG